MSDPTDIMTGARLADTIRTVHGAMRGASALQLAALDRLLAHVRATEALTAAHRPSAAELRGNEALAAEEARVRGLTQREQWPS